MNQKEKKTNIYTMAVSGGSGSGKSTFILSLQEECIHPITIFTQDNYYLDLTHLSSEEISKRNFDHPGALDSKLMIKDFYALHSGQSIQSPLYDFKTHTRCHETETISPNKILIFDGIFSLHFKELLPLFDLKIFLDVDDDTRFIRRLTRDIKTRGRSTESISEQYLKTVKPMHEKYIKPQKKETDLIIPWEQKNATIIALLAELLSSQHQRF